jgi:hypothetical protein
MGITLKTQLTNLSKLSLTDYWQPIRTNTPSCITFPANAENFDIKLGVIQLLPKFHGLDYEIPSPKSTYHLWAYACKAEPRKSLVSLSLYASTFVLLFHILHEFLQKIKKQFQ